MRRAPFWPVLEPELDGALVANVPTGLFGLNPLERQDFVALIEEVAPELVFGR